MQIGAISGCTRILRAPAGCEDTCEDLKIRDIVALGQPAMVSAWYPSPEELKHMANGAPIYLIIFGTQHPMVGLHVEENKL